MADAVYNDFKSGVVSGLIDLGGDTFKIMLVTATYAPNVDTHTFRSSVTNEVSGTGYTAGGQALANVSLTTDDTNDRAVWNADDPVWTASTITARGAVIYQDTGNAATDRLVCYLDFGSDIASTNADFTVTFNATGIITFD